MKRIPALAHAAASLLMVGLLAGCGSAPPPEDKTAADEYDPVASIVGDVEVDHEETGEGDATGADEAYKGPTKVTINIKLINDKNPEGSFKLIDASGTAIIEGGELGSEVEINQGVYSIEFKTPLVFGEPTYLVEDVEVVGEKMAVDEVFPAGQITLHTFRGKAEGRCTPTSFTVFDKTNEKELTGKGKTCQPLILETGHYEVRLDISKKKIQPVEMRINREQVQTSKVKLDK